MNTMIAWHMFARIDSKRSGVFRLFGNGSHKVGV